MLRHLIFAATALAAVALAAPAMAADFGAALRAHLNAVSAKDLSGLERTLTSGERLELYFPGRRTATRGGAPIVHPLTDEAWGQRRFMIRDPAGVLVDVVQQIEPQEGFWDRYPAPGPGAGQ